jgi:hypothetical protein
MTSLNELNIGKFINIVSTDFAEIDSGFIWMIALTGAPMITFISFFITWRSFGAWSLVGNGVLFIFQPFQTWMAGTTGAP